jgi:Family of unknown function (DUF6498)
MSDLARLFTQLPASSYWLIVANVLPLVGVLLWGWSTFAIVMIYWCENVVIGVINVLKMICCMPDPEEIERAGLAQGGGTQTRAAVRAFKSSAKPAGLLNQASKLFLIPFFIFHYGMFCMIHGVFVVALLGDKGTDHFVGSPIAVFSNLFSRAADAGLLWAVAGLAASHLYSFFTNYLGQGEYRRTVVPALMAQPYGRIVVLHIAILFGAFITMALGSPIFILVLLILGKTALDLKFHLRERQKNAAEQMVTSGGVA